MLIQFSFKNYLSFKETTDFKMTASSIKELKEANVIEVSDDLKLLKSAVIYGKNSSGKSNLVKGMKFMDTFVRTSLNEKDEERDLFDDYYKLNSECEKIPTYFEVVISAESRIFRYGFEIGRKEIETEWLIEQINKKESVLFTRENTSQISVNETEFSEGKGLEGKTRRDALFLTVCSQFNGQISKIVRRWFSNFNVLNGTYDHSYTTMRHARKDERFLNRVADLLDILDTDISKIEIEKISFEESMLHQFSSYMNEEYKKTLMEEVSYRVNTFHKKFDGNNKYIGDVKFDLEKNESEGTRKIFNLAGPIIDTLINGKVLVIDELDSKLHERITKFFMILFNNSANKGAQVIIVTHDSSLLDGDIFRRDQMWFVEKDKWGGSKLFSLVEIKFDNKKVRNDASFDKDYIEGKYGAVPVIKNPGSIFKEES